MVICWLSCRQYQTTIVIDMGPCRLSLPYRWITVANQCTYQWLSVSVKLTLGYCYCCYRWLSLSVVISGYRKWLTLYIKPSGLSVVSYRKVTARWLFSGIHWLSAG